MFLRGVLGYLPVNLIQAGVGFGSIVVLTRLLSPEDYGAYALAFSITSLVHLCMFTWIEAAVGRFYAAEAEADRGALVATVYSTVGVLALLLPLAIGALWLTPLALDLKMAVSAGLACAAAQSVLKVAQERRRAAGEVKSFAVLEMLQNAGGFALAIVFALIGLGAAAPLAGVGAASALCMLWGLSAEVKRARSGRFDRARLVRYAAYGVPLSLSLMMNVSLQSVDRFVIAAYLDQAAVGAYHAGYTLSNRTLDVMFLWLAMAGHPACVAALERGGPAALAVTARSQVSLMLLIGAPAAAGVALVASPLAHLMIGGGLAETAARVTPWIAAGAFLSGITNQYLNTAFTLARRTGRLMVVISIPAVANLALMLLLIPRYGLDGAMWAMVATYAIGMVASVVLARGCCALPIPWATVAKTAVATAVMALAVASLPAIGGVGEIALKGACGVLVYAVAAIALNIAGVRSQIPTVLAMVFPKAARA